VGFPRAAGSGAEKEPTFRLLRSTEVLAPIIARDAQRQSDWCQLRDSGGQVRELYAELTVACDGRSSTLRDTMGLKPRNFGAPMDVWWFRLPRTPTTRTAWPECWAPATRA